MDLFVSVTQMAYETKHVSINQGISNSLFLEEAFEESVNFGMEKNWTGQTKIPQIKTMKPRSTKYDHCKASGEPYY